MKNLFILLVAGFQLTACSVFKPGERNADNSSQARQGSSQGSQPEFITQISTRSDRPAEAGSNSGMKKKTAVSSADNTLTPTESYDPLQYKFAILTNSPVEWLTNEKLLVFMDQWYGAPYHYGGTARDGIDCSAFTCQLMSEVYSVNQLPRVSADQFSVTKRISKKELREGDLVFFHTYGKGRRVTHVGVYLYNNRFVHASVSGVQINDLSEGYYQQHYVGAGRILGNDSEN
jgi:lipoprotein Spr